MNFKLNLLTRNHMHIHTERERERWMLIAYIGALCCYFSLLFYSERASWDEFVCCLFACLWMISLEIPISPYIGLTKHLFFSLDVTSQMRYILSGAVTTISVTKETRTHISTSAQNFMNPNIDCFWNTQRKLDYYTEIQQITSTTWIH